MSELKVCNNNPKCRNPKVIDEHGDFKGCMKCDACATAIREILERIVSKNKHLQHEKRVWEDRINQIRELTSPGIHGPLFYKEE